MRGGGGELAPRLPGCWQEGQVTIRPAVPGPCGPRVALGIPPRSVLTWDQASTCANAGWPGSPGAGPGCQHYSRPCWGPGAGGLVGPGEAPQAESRPGQGTPPLGRGPFALTPACPGQPPGSPGPAPGLRTRVAQDGRVVVRQQGRTYDRHHHPLSEPAMTRGIGVDTGRWLRDSGGMARRSPARGATEQRGRGVGGALAWGQLRATLFLKKKASLARLVWLSG